MAIMNVYARWQKWLVNRHYGGSFAKIRWSSYAVSDGSSGCFSVCNLRIASCVVALVVATLLIAGPTAADEITPEVAPSGAKKEGFDPCELSSLEKTQFCSAVVRELHLHEISSPDLFARVAFALTIGRAESGVPTVFDVNTVQQLVYGIVCAEELMRRGQGGLWIAADMAEIWSLLAYSADMMPRWAAETRKIDGPTLSIREKRELGALADLLEQMPKLTSEQFPIARDRVLNTVPNHPQTLRAAARADLAARRDSEALGWLDQYEDRDVDNPYTALMRLQAWARVGASEAMLEKNVQRIRKLAPTWGFMASALKNSAVLVEKRKQFVESDEVAVTSAAQIQQIHSLIDDGWTQQAASRLLLLEQEHPKDRSVAAAAVGLWVTLNDRGQWEAAIRRLMDLLPPNEQNAELAWQGRLLGALRFRVFAGDSAVSLVDLPEFQAAQKIDPVIARHVEVTVLAIQWLRHRNSGSDKDKTLAACLDKLREAPQDPVVVRTVALLLWLLGEKDKAINTLRDSMQVVSVDFRDELGLHFAMLAIAYAAQSGVSKYLNDARAVLTQITTHADRPERRCPASGCVDRQLVEYVGFSADLVDAIIKDDVALQANLARRAEQIGRSFGLLAEYAPRIAASLFSVGTFVAITQGLDTKALELTENARMLSPEEFPVVYDLALLALGRGDELVARFFFDKAVMLAETPRDRHLIARLGLKFAEIHRSKQELKEHLETLLATWDSAVPAGDGAGAVELVVFGDIAFELSLEHGVDEDRLVVVPTLIQTISAVRTMRGLTRGYINDLLAEVNGPIE